MTDTDTPQRPDRLPGNRTLPDHLSGRGGDAFSWGPIVAIHEAGPYAVVEYLDDRSNFASADDWVDHGRTVYAAFVDGHDTSTSFSTLDEALLFLIARRNTEVNQARHVARFLARGLGIKEADA